MSVETTISPLVESLFPQFYHTEGQNFVAFVKAYYEWLEENFQWLQVTDTTGFAVDDTISQVQSTTTTATGTVYSITDDHLLVRLTSWAPFRCRDKCNVLAPITNGTVSSTLIMQDKLNPLFEARSLLKYRNVDETIDLFILQFKEKYLKNIQFNTATNKQLLIKNSLDLYRSKGTERAVELFFKLVYNKNASVYYPGDDLFKLSDGDWYKAQYLEISKSSRTIDLVGKTICGMSSGAEAFVEKYIKRKIATGYIHVIFISNVVGTFEKGELLRTTGNIYTDAPKVLGSLNALTVITAGSGYEIGDIVDVVDDYGQFGKARVVSTTTTTGEVEFLFYSGGYGYSTSPTEYLSDKILGISNISTTDSQYWRDFDNLTQPLANLTFLTLSSNAIANGVNVYSYYANGDLSGQGIVLDRTMSTIVGVTIDTDANATTLLTVTTGNTDDISVGDLVVGSTNTAVVNTDVSAKVTSITNSSAFEVNADIIVANGTASITTSSTSDVGELFVYITSGEFVNTLAVYTVSNAISGTLETVLDKTVRAKIIKPGDIIKLAVSNAQGTFAVGDLIYQSNGTADVANGTIYDLSISGGVGFIDIENYGGILDTDYGIAVYSSNATCNLDSFTSTLAVQFNREKNVEVTVNTAANATTLLEFSTGNTQYLQPGDYISFSSNTSVVNTSLTGYISSIVNTTAVVVNADVIEANGTATVTFYDITDNDFVANTTVFATTIESNTTFIIDSISLGSGADYALINVETSEEVFLNTDLVSGNNVSNVEYLSLGVEASAYGFPRDETANLSSYVMSAFNYSLYQLGSITDVITVNPGTDYTLAPIAVVLEAPVAALNLKDYILTVEEVPGTIQVGDTITQNVGNVTQLTLSGVSNAEPFYVGETVFQGANLEASTANGVVYLANTVSNTLILVGVNGTFANSANVESYITGNSVTYTTSNSSTFTAEVARGTVTQTILGSSNTTTLYVARKSVPSFVVSGNVITSTANVTANVTAVAVDTDSIQIGLNANIEANVVISEGAVSELEVVDSGFGYPNNAVVTFIGDESTHTSGTARTLVDDTGESLGRYRNSKGFLSEDKYLFDGEYYQEYSYEILSSFSFDKYSDIFKKVMHVAGTKVFGGVILQDTGNIVLSANETSLTQA